MSARGVHPAEGECVTMPESDELMSAEPEGGGGQTPAELSPPLSYLREGLVFPPSLPSFSFFAPSLFPSFSMSLSYSFSFSLTFLLSLPPSLTLSLLLCSCCSRV